jgi:hypothetical protein
VCELGQLYSILLAQQALVVPTFLDIVDLQCLVTRRGQEELALVVIIDGKRVGLRIASLDVFASKELFASSCQRR